MSGMKEDSPDEELSRSDMKRPPELAEGVKS